MLQHFLHSSAECRGGISESEVHDHGFIESEGCFEGRLPAILLLDADVIIAPTNVELGKEGFALKAFNDVTNEGKGVVVVNSLFVQGSVVHNGMKLTTLLFMVEQGGSVWRF